MFDSALLHVTSLDCTLMYTEDEAATSGIYKEMGKTEAAAEAGEPF